MFQRSLSVFFFAFFLFQDSQGQNIKRIQQYMDSVREATDIPGMTVSFIQNGRLYSLATGYSDLESRIPMKPTDQMLAGSTGKTFFASLAMKMIQAGKIHLDDRVSEYLGKQEWWARIPNHDSITIRMLMSHRSGIEEYYELGDFLQKLESDPSKVWTPLELISYVFDRKPLFPVGTGFGYADTNYLILGLLLETVSQIDLYTWIRSEILSPLRLIGTAPSNSRELRGLIPGYIGSGLLKQEGKTIQDGKFIINPEFEWAGGGFLSSSPDLAKWARIYYRGDWAKAMDTASMHKGLPANTGPGQLYGLGMQIRPSSFGWSFGHGGWFPGYLTEMEYFPDIDFSIALQINTDNFRKLGQHPHVLLLKILNEIQSGRN